MTHRFIGDHAGRRDMYGHLLPVAPAAPAPEAAPVLCAVCRATPDDPECICVAEEATHDPAGILLIPDDVATPPTSEPEAAAPEADSAETPPADAE